MIFMAPEIFLHNGDSAAYKPSVDMWSLGISIYYLLCGDYPFNYPNIDDKIQDDPLEFKHAAWGKIS